MPEQPLHDTAEAVPRLPLRVTRGTVLFSLACMAAAVALIPNAEANWLFVYDAMLRPLDSLDEFFSTTRQFVEVSAITAMVILVWIHKVDARRTIIPFLIALTLASGVVSVLKQATGRARPGWGMRIGFNSEQMQWIRDYTEGRTKHPPKGEPKPNPVMLRQLEQGKGDYWLLLSPHRPWLENEYAAFPSGHATSGFVLAMWLSLVLPKGRLVFYILAGGTALARIRFRQHHLEDVLFGAGLGTLICAWVFSWTWAAQAGERFARRFTKQAIT